MKLNYRKTVEVGFAFLAICAFWQMYNNIIPLILTNTFHINETFSGVIMAADNVLALFLLPLFGGISDRCKSKMGRRKPFILFGTIASVILMMLLPLLDDSYFDAPNTFKLVLFVVVLGGLLISMGTYRSPAVALMPDVTPKPLRSMGNAIINLCGAVGGIIYLIITSILYSKARTEGMEHVSYVLLFGIVAGIMIISLIVLFTRVDEVALCEEQKKYEMENEDASNEEGASTEENSKLAPDVRRSLIFLLLSVALWYIGFNAIETWFTTFAQKQWGLPLGTASLCLTIGSVGSIISYIPAGILAGKIGRRKTILLGVAILASMFFGVLIFTITLNEFSPVICVLFVFIGSAWAIINVNSFPMVVEMCKGSEIGKFTGMYYTFSMAAQTITPIIAGWLLRYVGYWTLFLYAAIAVACAFVTMLVVHHGDAQAVVKSGLEAYDVED